MVCTAQVLLRSSVACIPSTSSRQSLIADGDSSRVSAVESHRSSVNRRTSAQNRGSVSNCASVSVPEMYAAASCRASSTAGRRQPTAAGRRASLQPKLRRSSSVSSEQMVQVHGKQLSTRRRLVAPVHSRAGARAGPPRMARNHQNPTLLADGYIFVRYLNCTSPHLLRCTARSVARCTWRRRSCSGAGRHCRRRTPRGCC